MNTWVVEGARPWKDGGEHWSIEGVDLTLRNNTTEEWVTKTIFTDEMSAAQIRLLEIAFPVWEALRDTFGSSDAKGEQWTVEWNEDTWAVEGVRPWSESGPGWHNEGITLVLRHSATGEWARKTIFADQMSSAQIRLLKIALPVWEALQDMQGQQEQQQQ